MGKNSKIEWTHHTFNPWWGCTRVSAACKHCYAEAWSKRVGKKVWGPKAPRRFFGDAHWNGPKKWNEEARARGERARVFCASMADVFEARKDLDASREQLWDLIEETPHLDWLLLTKRPERILKTVRWSADWPRNVWVGTTVEDQESAEERLPHLARIPAAVRFISAEPLLSELNIGNWLGSSIDWVITGGESGPHARPSSPSWFRNLLIQCMQANVPFHFKQWGDWAPGQGINLAAVRKTAREAQDGTLMLRLGKKAAGRLLDGETWDGLPTKRAA
jgi:protein gp37